MLPGTPPACPHDTRPARVVRVDRSAYDVLCEDGPGRVPGLPPPHEVTVGDWLAVRDGAAVAVLPRTSLLVRACAGGQSRTQPLAANVDTVLVCAPLSGNPPVRKIERLLALAWESGASPAVVLTKADLHPDPERAARELAPHAPAVPVLLTSATEGDVAALAPYALPGSTLVLLGPSGAGKSTVVNALAGGEVMTVREVRDADLKGRHTTTHRQLVVLPSGAVVIDTPGLRGIALGGSDEGVARAFSDVEELAAACRFADCAHAGEPGCAVQASIDAGDLPAARIASWRKLQREVAYQARRTDARLRAADKARWKAIAKSSRGARP